MAVTSVSSREFNQHTNEAKLAAKEGPVFITDRGRPAHVLLSIEDYHRLVGKGPKIADLLAMPGVAEVDFEVLLSRDLARGADLR